MFILLFGDKELRQRPQIAFKYRYRLKKQATHPERKFKGILKSLGIDNKFQWIFFGKKRFVIADFYLPRFRVVLEIDGKDHLKEENRIYDEYRTKFLMNRCNVEEVIRFPNQMVRQKPEEIEDILAHRFCEVGEDFFSQAFRATIG